MENYKDNPDNTKIIHEDVTTHAFQNSHSFGISLCLMLEER